MRYNSYEFKSESILTLVYVLLIYLIFLVYNFLLELNVISTEAKMMILVLKYVLIVFFTIKIINSFITLIYYKKIDKSKKL